MSSVSTGAAFRKATPADLPEINAVRNYYIKHTTSNLLFDEVSDAEFSKGFHSRDEKTPLYAVELNKKIIGFGSIGYFGDRPGYRVTAELGFYLAPEAHGRGLGKGIVLFLLEEAKKFGFHSVLCRVTSENEVSLKLHHKLGFTQVATLKEIGRKFDRYVDVHFFQKMI